MITRAAYDAAGRVTVSTDIYDGRGRAAHFSTYGDALGLNAA